ncbi:hypothetical protein DQG13_15850 [Paenibacillus sp. YN15]|nr:hypothetical protein DQG13_15850 [Paenibacillus sp. YN15]
MHVTKTASGMETVFSLFPGGVSGVCPTEWFRRINIHRISFLAGKGVPWMLKHVLSALIESNV